MMALLRLSLCSCAGDGEWYLLEQQTYRELLIPGVPLSMSGYLVNTPKTQTATAGGLEITAELFRESYKLCGQDTTDVIGSCRLEVELTVDK